MVGPVLYQEMLLGARRSRWHIFRWVYAIWLIVLFGFWAMMYFLSSVRFSPQQPPGYQLMSEISLPFIEFLATQHFVLLTLITPVLTAGAITDEKWRGTLQYLLTADLFPSEIILGKLIGRIYQGIVLSLIALPILCFIGCISGLGLVQIGGFIVSTIVLLFGLGSMSLLASVWCRHTRDAVLGVYCIGVLVFWLIPWVLSLLPLPQVAIWGEYLISYLNPINPLGEEWVDATDQELAQRILVIASIWSVFGLLCLMMAVLSLRRSYIRQLEKSGTRRKRHWWTFNRPPMKNAPLTWKERYVEGISPLAFLRRVPTWIGVTFVFAITTIAYGWVILEYLPVWLTSMRILEMALALDVNGLWNVAQRLDVPSTAFYHLGWAVLLLTGLVIGVRCSGAVTGEREKMTWEALLLTPLETKQLIRGKLWGIAGASVPYLLAYAIPALMLSLLAGIGAFYWTLLWLAVTVLGIFYVGAAGIWCSVRSASSWRSLLMTLGFTYVGGFFLFMVTFVLAAILALILTLMFMLVDMLLKQYFQIQTSFGSFALAWSPAFYNAICIVLAIWFVVLSWMLLRGAEYRVSVLERTKHWKKEPRPRRRRRKRRQPPILLEGE